MRGQNLIQLVEKCREQLQALRYAKATVENYRYTWSKFREFATTKGITSYTTENGLLFLNEKHGINPDSCDLDRGKSHIRRSIEMLDYYYKNGRIDRHRHKKIHVWPEQYHDFCEEFMLSLAPKLLSERTLRKYRTFAKDFTEYLAAQNGLQLENITGEVIDTYLLKYRGYAHSTIGWCCAAIATLLEYAHMAGHTQMNKAIYAPQITGYKYPAPPSTYSEDEIKRILSAVDRAVSLGERV